MLVENRSYVDYSSVHIVDMKNDAPVIRNSYFASIQVAMALIEHNDLSAWRIVERELNYIVNMHMSSAGCYVWLQRCCYVDYERYFRRNNKEEEMCEWYIAALASTIVHEAMHGHLCSLGIPYNKTTRERVERICVRRQRRFLSRLHSDQYDLTTVIPPFNAHRWNYLWQRGATLKVFREIWQRKHNEQEK